MREENRYLIKLTKWTVLGLVVVVTLFLSSQAMAQYNGPDDFVGGTDSIVPTIVCLSIVIIGGLYFLTSNDWWK